MGDEVIPNFRYRLMIQWVEVIAFSNQVAGMDLWWLASWKGDVIVLFLAGVYVNCPVCILMSWSVSGRVGQVQS